MRGFSSHHRQSVTSNRTQRFDVMDVNDELQRLLYIEYLCEQLRNRQQDEEHHVNDADDSGGTNGGDDDNVRNQQEDVVNHTNDEQHVDNGKFFIPLQCDTLAAAEVNFNICSFMKNKRRSDEMYSKSKI